MNAIDSAVHARETSTTDALPGLIVRVGVPLPGGRLVRVARDARLSVLFSANAFMVKNEDGESIRVRTPNREEWGNLDAALDSAGFVAAARYNGYPWTQDQYLDLVESYPWKFYSSMDLCVEPEIAGSKPEVFFRIAETCRMLGELSRRAADRGLPAPMPVIQGWELDHYLWCVDHLPLWQWPDLIGVGSMCRRKVHGPNGILAIIDGLDRILPPQVKFHLFGVKGMALEYLTGHPRIASTDSMAWDFALRKAMPVGRTQTVRGEAMNRWATKMADVVAGPRRPYDACLFNLPSEMPSEALDEWLELVAGNEIDARSASIHAMREWCFE